VVIGFVVAGARLAAQAPAYDLTAVRNQFTNNLGVYTLGLTVQIEQRGRSLLSYQSGLVNAQTKLGIASCTKWLSGAVVLILAERGYFDLDDRIGNFLPALDSAGKGAPTIRQCFAMSSGFYLNLPNYEVDKTLTLAQSVDLIIANTPIVYPPGTQLAYDGDGMQIVGRICEIVTGKAWATLADEVLFTPLGMSDSTYDFFELNPAIAAGVRSTSTDYMKFLRMLLSNGLAPDGTVVMSTRSVEIFFQNQTQDLPEYYSPWPDIDYDVYGNRGDYGMGSWILAQPAPGAPVEEVTSPGAFGSLPWIDRRRGVIGVAFTFTAGGSVAHQNTLRALTYLRAEIDVKGLPDVGEPGSLVLSRASGIAGNGATGGFLRLDWSGGGVLEASSDLQTWTALPLVSTPFVERLDRLPSARSFYRVRY
jgi:CubicO group peptidase (beta-lactamase class C family)